MRRQHGNQKRPGFAHIETWLCDLEHSHRFSLQVPHLPNGTAHPPHCSSGVLYKSGWISFVGVNIVLLLLLLSSLAYLLLLGLLLKALNILEGQDDPALLLLVLEWIALGLGHYRSFEDKIGHFFLQ